MTGSPSNDRIRWSIDPANPVIRPGMINGELDAHRAGAAHVLRLGDKYHIYYWGIGSDGRNRICRGESSINNPNDWAALGSVLEPQPEIDYNSSGPSFPFVIPSDDGPWLMYFGAWGRAREDGKLPNTTGLAISDDEGRTWHYWSDRPVLALDKPYDREATGSCCVLRVGGELRMYYTAIGHYFQRPEGVQTGHGEVIPRIGIAYAVSDDGIHWHKPLDDLMVSPRGFDTEPYEYICSKPCVIAERNGYRMWVSTFGPAYRIRSLTSPDGLNWAWQPGGPDGDMGIGASGQFDDHQRSYASVVLHGDEYRCWYTGNDFGTTGTGYATGTSAKE